MDPNTNDDINDHISRLAAKVIQLVNRQDYTNSFWDIYFTENTHIEVDSHVAIGIRSGLALMGAMITDDRPATGGSHQAIIEDISVSSPEDLDSAERRNLRRKLSSVAGDVRIAMLSVYLKGHNDTRGGQAMSIWEREDATWRCTKFSAISGIRNSAHGL